MPQQQQQFNMVPALATATTGAGCGGGGNQAASMIPQPVPPTVFSEPGSELTCNLSGSRKRPRDAQPPLVPLSSTALYQQQQQQFLLQKQLLLLNQINRKAHPTDPQAVETSRLNQSAVASTSGRPPLMLADAPVASLAANSITTATGPSSSSSTSSGLISMLHYHNLEVDALVRLHTEKLRSAMAESCKRHCRAVVAAMEQQAQRRVAEKQAELDAAAKRNADLEGRLRQAAADSQAWFNVAKTSEATVAGLRASLESALLQKLGAPNDGTNAGGVDPPAGAAAPEEEGYGDSQEEAHTAAASAAVSCSVRFVEPGITDTVKPSVHARRSSACRSCGEPDACVLLLPCRHLCLCRSCEPSLDVCPVCFSRKNASLHINLS